MFAKTLNELLKKEAQKHLPEIAVEQISDSISETYLEVQNKMWESFIKSMEGGKTIEESIKKSFGITAKVITATAPTNNKVKTLQEFLSYMDAMSKLDDEQGDAYISWMDVAFDKKLPAEVLRDLVNEFVAIIERDPEISPDNIGRFFKHKIEVFLSKGFSEFH